MKVDIIVPAAGESVKEADIASWSKSDGDFVAMDDVLLELETDKASMALNAEASGVLTIVKPEGETVAVGEVIGYITLADAPVQSSAAPAVTTPVAAKPAAAAPEQASVGHYATGHPSPAAAAILASANIAPDQVAGSGRDGRITPFDARSAKATLGSSHASISPAADVVEKVAPASSVIADRSERREKMSRLRRTVAQRLVNAQHTQALLTTFNEVDLTQVIAIRKKYKELFKEKHEVNLGFMSFFARATCEALADFPIMNASVDGDAIVYHDYCDIGIAVASPKGLVVPVLRSVEQMSFKAIESQIVAFAKKARDGQITLADMDGGTFTITNGGTFGSMLSTPIVNYPQSAILGMHNIIKRPVVDNNEIVIRDMMYLAVSYDHRIIDGADAVRFLVAIKERLEDPSRLLIGL